VVGNDDGELKRMEENNEVRVDFNAAILFDKGRIVDTYRKLHLVPFTEGFPFEKQLPGIYQWLKNADTHFWEKGKVYTVFDAEGVRFSTPICFEDTFGYLCRGFIRRGAQVLVNMTNDAWSSSVPCAMQHMTMAVFRAIENRRSVVRSTNGGMTTIIDPNGRIQSTLPPFTEGYLFGTVPVYTGTTTLYTRWGDWFPWLLLALTVAGLGIGAGRRIAGSRGRGGRHGDAT
jgi:apolipoprotein N-acyltransferase